ncbi:MAG: glutamine cyclotransferase, partial [Gammaproteobacteria bacterium]|nr:glutamine cyclotransferase [Gemmatimonadota bacterium]NIU76494.1 glutamine cyclotransferase [Gammaproteobacteria bacterium]
VAAVSLVPLLACGAGDAADRVQERPPFDADSAYALLVRQVEFGPRVPGTDGHAAQLAWMTSYLEERADT